MTEAERRRTILYSTIKLLSTHGPFQEFMGAIAQLREESIRDACRLDVVDNPGRLASIMGAVGAYTDIQQMVEEAKASKEPLDTSA